MKRQYIRLCWVGQTNCGGEVEIREKEKELVEAK